MLEEEVYAKAVKVLEKCSTKNGFYAAYPGYDMVFGRDSMIMSLGASLVETSLNLPVSPPPSPARPPKITSGFSSGKFQEVIAASLMTLAENQSERGQIPNAVDKYSKRKKHVDFKSIDSSLWFLIGEWNYAKNFGPEIFGKHGKNIEKTFNWLSFQDIGEDGMLEQLPTTDWEDAFPHKYGHTINTQALYYRVLNIYGKKKEAAELKEKVNEDLDDGLWKGDFYFPWRWKNHGKYQEKGEWFDSLGNLLAIVFELADEKRAEKILNYIKKEKINLPWPMKAMYPPISSKDREWQDYYLDCAAGKPNCYLNGGIWTFIGGFYVCALVKTGKFEEAREQLKKLAEANMLKPEFSEWLHGKTGKPGVSGSGEKDGGQGWNAAMYIVAYNSVKEKKCLL
jgi:glycogen debranching enzyme